MIRLLGLTSLSSTVQLQSSLLLKATWGKILISDDLTCLLGYKKTRQKAVTAAVPSHLLLRHWVYHLFKEEILKRGIPQWLDKHSLAPPKLQTPPSKTNQSWLCECSFTRYENMKTLLVDHQVPCWDCTNGLPTPVCHLLTSQNQSQTCPGKMLELHHKEVELTSWRAYFGFSESVTLPSVRRKDDWLSYSWIRRDILIWRYSEKSVYSVNTDC